MIKHSANKKIILGGAQFGMSYSISKIYDYVNENIKYKLLNFAYNNGINSIDLAQSYGNSEMLVGNYIKKNKKHEWVIITKTNVEQVNITNSLSLSIEKLGVTPNTVLAHKVENYLNKEYCHLLHSLKDNGIKKIGVSTYNIDDIKKVLTVIKPDIIQFPLNIVDNKIYKTNMLEYLKDQGIELHARSIWLQGLFHLPVTKIRKKFKDILPTIEKLSNLALSYKITLPELSLKWVYSLPEVDKVIIGIEDINQLKANLKTLETEVDKDVFREALLINYENENILNPSLWT